MGETQNPIPSFDAAPGLLGTIYGIFFRPAATLGYVAREGRVGRALLVLSGVYAFGILMELALGRPVNLETAARSLPPGWEAAWPGIAANLQVGFLLTGILVAVGFWWIQAAVVHLAAQLLGGHGSGPGYLAAMGYTVLPNLLATLVDALLRLAGRWQMLSWLVAFAVTLWVLWLQVLATREGHGLSTGMAVLALALPLATVLAFAVIAVILLAALLVPLIPSLN